MNRTLEAADALPCDELVTCWLGLSQLGVTQGPLEAVLGRLRDDERKLDFNSHRTTLEKALIASMYVTKEDTALEASLRRQLHQKAKYLNPAQLCLVLQCLAYSYPRNGDPTLQMALFARLRIMLHWMPARTLCLSLLAMCRFSAPNALSKVDYLPRTIGYFKGRRVAELSEEERTELQLTVRAWLDVEQSRRQPQSVKFLGQLRTALHQN